MIIFREHPIFFLGLKYVQLLFSILVVVFEITQYVSYGKNGTQAGENSNGNFGDFEVWTFVVCNVTILSLLYNLFSFKTIWERGFIVWSEILFAALWLSVGSLELNKGTDDLNCKSPSLDEGPPKQFICNVRVTSLIFGWFIFGTFMFTAFISWKISKETEEKTKWIKKTYSSEDSYNNNSKRKSFYVSSVPHPIITVQNNPSDELEKGGVPELLLQSGLPADHRMSLKVVLPQSGGPFSQSNNDDSSDQQQKQDEIGNNLTFPLPPAKVNDSTLTLPDVTDDNVEQHEIFNSNNLIVPSKKSAEVSSLHEVPL